jgi:quercetin dioxygenase-like cupin family protein
MIIQRCSLKGQSVLTTNLNQAPLLDTWFEHDPTQRCRVVFPFFRGNGAESLAVVYFEIQPGDTLATHTDSAEEIVLVLQGEVEASVGEERGRLSAGEMVLIPAMAPHGIVNTGDETARCVGFFSEGTVESTFQQPVMPMGVRALNTSEIPHELRQHANGAR